MGLRRRIVIPFVALFTVGYAATVGATLVVVTGLVEERLKDQARSLAEVTNKAPMSAQYAGILGTLYRADLAIFREKQLAGSTALRPEALDELRKVTFWPAEDEFVSWRGYLAIRHGESFLFYPPDVLDAEKRAVVKPIVVISSIGLVAVLLFGMWIGHSVARPLELLATRAKHLGEGSEPSLVNPGGGPEISHLVETLNRMLEQLRRSERLAVMGQLAAGVAHEIKNPLSAMKMTVQMLREEQQGTAREPYDLVLREIERLDLAASELSAAARPVPLVKTPVRLDQTVGEVLDLLQPQLNHLGVKIDRRFDAPGEVPVDVNRFKRAAMNLVLNGAQSMPQGGTLTVALGSPNGNLRFSVTDTGKGIPPELRDRIFEPFVTGKADGIGLGLALTKRIVEDHGGRIGFDSSDKGSTFWIDLPKG